jgi:glutathione peroxidase
MSQNFYSFTVKAADGQNLSLEKFRGKVVLAVNVASKCGFTPQYKGLESLYEKFSGKDFVILAFPCNQFGSQEPGSNDEIQSFCQMNYGVSFPVMAKIDVNGEKADPVYSWMKAAAPGVLGTEMIKWNFTKFLIGKDGQVIRRYPPQTEPQDIEADVEKALTAP